VRVSATEACPLYVGRIVRGLDSQAPRRAGWLSGSSAAASVRCCAPVDITNYVLLELGQPMHAFALSRLQGGIEVRLARAGETLELLNGQTVELAPDMLVIADDNGPVALAGIMGGQPTSVETRHRRRVPRGCVLRARGDCRTRAPPGLSTDSSHRFERGVDFGATRQAMERATQLLLDICGGQAGPIIEAVATLPGASRSRCGWRA
jgi:phenylalanyl-tRNA synthetase beta chain